MAQPLTNLFVIGKLNNLFKNKAYKSKIIVASILLIKILKIRYIISGIGYICPRSTFKSIFKNILKGLGGMGYTAFVIENAKLNSI